MPFASGRLNSAKTSFANDVFAELSLPLANGMTGVENLELGLAARYSNYDSFGGQITYKAGLTYAPVKEFALRSTYGTAYNAPSISALYGGTADGYPSVTDPCSTFHNAGELPANCADVTNAFVTSAQLAGNSPALWKVLHGSVTDG